VPHSHPSSDERPLADSGHLARNLAVIAAGTLQRGTDVAESEDRLRCMLLEVERLAVLANNNAVRRSTQAHSYGSCAPALP
jgi:hypothetical protein